MPPAVIATDVASKAIIDRVLDRPLDTRKLGIFAVGSGIYEYYGRGLFGKIPGFDRLQDVSVGNFDLGKPVAIALYTVVINLVMGQGLPSIQQLLITSVEDTAALSGAGFLQDKLNIS